MLNYITQQAGMLLDLLMPAQACLAVPTPILLVHGWRQGKLLTHKHWFSVHARQFAARQA